MSKIKKERAEKSLRSLYKLSIASGGEKFCIIVDESYCSLGPSQVPGDEYYHTVDNCEVDVEARKKRKLKLYDKYLA